MFRGDFRVNLDQLGSVDLFLGLLALWRVTHRSSMRGGLGLLHRSVPLGSWLVDLLDLIHHDFGLISLVN